MLKVYKEEKKESTCNLCYSSLLDISLWRNLSNYVHTVVMYMDVHSTVHNLIYTHFFNKHTYTVFLHDTLHCSVCLLEPISNAKI